jgi:hypothetical protein
MPNVPAPPEAPSPPCPPTAWPAARQPSGRPITVVDGRLRYADEQHLPAASWSVVSIADAMAAVPGPVPYPPKAVAPPDRYTGWGSRADASRSHDSGVLVHFLRLFHRGRDHFERRGAEYVEGYADAMFVHGDVAYRQKRRCRR